MLYYSYANNLDALKDRRPIVISGPSGVGKGTLCQMLKDAHPGNFATTVSHTTRQPRPGESDGITYFYVTSVEFDSLISQNAFVEYTFFGGNRYGTSKQAITDETAKELVVVLDIEIHGVQQMKDVSSIDARYVFIRPPSFEALEDRLRSRGTEDEKHVQDRLTRARVELEYAETPGAFDKIITNDDLQNAYQELSEYVHQ
jgi:guanylate kinase